MRIVRLAAVFLLFIAFYTSSVKAVLISAGESSMLAGTTLLENPDLAGSILFDDTESDLRYISFPLRFIGGQVRNRVVRSSNTGNLVFTPRFEYPFNISLDNYLVDRIEYFGFGDFVTDLNYLTDMAGDRGPNLASRSADGETLIFDFLFPIVVGNLVGEPQETSRFISIATDATDYRLDGRILIHGRHPDFASETFTLSYANIAVPVDVNEPGAFILTFIGLFIVLYRPGATGSNSKPPMARLKC